MRVKIPENILGTMSTIVILNWVDLVLYHIGRAMFNRQGHYLVSHAMTLLTYALLACALLALLACAHLYSNCMITDAWQLAIQTRGSHVVFGGDGGDSMGKFFGGCSMVIFIQ